MHEPSHLILYPTYIYVNITFNCVLYIMFVQVEQSGSSSWRD